MAEDKRVECPHCGNDDRSLLTRLPLQTPSYYCESCAKEFIVRAEKDRRKSHEE